MALVDHPPLQLRNLRRSLEAHVPLKAVRDVINLARFGRDAPLSDECLWVDPGEIAHAYVPASPKTAPNFRRRDSGKIVGGDWDLSVRPIEADVKYASCMAHFRDGVDWRDTPVWEKMLTSIARKGIADGCRNEEDVAKRYAQLDRISREALRTRRLNARVELAGAYFRREHGGILVHIARDGSLLRSGGGMHRFALARALELSLIPVQLGVIHKDAVDSGIVQRLRKRPANYPLT